jgi:hypothetical protein
LSFTGCSGLKPGNPPSYTTCTPPVGSSGFSASDWTAVINETLAEIYSAEQVVSLFSQLNQVRRDTFIAENTALPAIDSQLKLAGAADLQTEFDVKEMYSTVLEILGAIAGEASGPLGVALEVSGTLIGALPSASPTLTSTLDTTYSGLQSKFASAVSEVDKALAVQSQAVRQSYGLLTLLGQLRTRGTWPAQLDQVGLKSEAQQGFSLWIYKQLLPTLYARYSVSNCLPRNLATGVECQGPAAGQGVIGGGTTFTALGPPPHRRPDTPCHASDEVFVTYCTYETLPVDLATTLFGPVSSTCAYQPGKASTAWTFGCNLGVPEQYSVSLAGDANGWKFSSYSGDPVVMAGASGSATVGARGGLRFTGRIILPRRFRLSRTRVVADRLLYEQGRRGELVRGPGGRAWDGVRLSRRGPGGVLTDRPRGPRLRLRLRRLSGQRIAYHLSASRVRVLVPAACDRLAASDALVTPPVRLDLRLRLSDGRRRSMVSLPIVWRCVRARHGMITTLRTVAPKRLAARRGLGVSLRGPRTVKSGTTATYRVRVLDRRAGSRKRLRSALWHVIVEETTEPPQVSRRPTTVTRRRLAIRRIHELRRGRSRTYLLRVRVPRAARGRSCVSAMVLADAARPARARLCAHVVSR